MLRHLVLPICPERAWSELTASFGGHWGGQRQAAEWGCPAFRGPASQALPPPVSPAGPGAALGPWPAHQRAGLEPGVRRDSTPHAPGEAM